MYYAASAVMSRRRAYVAVVNYRRRGAVEAMMALYVMRFYDFAAREPCREGDQQRD
jgi:hypothetical protein